MSMKKFVVEQKTLDDLIADPKWEFGMSGQMESAC